MAASGFHVRALRRPDGRTALRVFALVRPFEPKLPSARSTIRVLESRSSSRSSTAHSFVARLLHFGTHGDHKSESDVDYIMSHDSFVTNLAIQYVDLGDSPTAIGGFLL